MKFGLGLGIVFIFLLLFSCSSPVTDIEMVEEQDGLIYLKENHKLYSGKVVSTYPDGTVSFECNYKNGLKDGEMVRFYENGQLSFKGQYINGESVKGYFQWYENGNLKTEMLFQDENHGLLKEYYIDGGLKTKAGYINDSLLDGEVATYF